MFSGGTDLVYGRFLPPPSLCCPKCSQLWSRHRVSTSGPPCTLLGSWHHSLQTIFRNTLSSAHSYAKTTLVLGTRHRSQPSRLQHFVDPPSFDKKRRLSNYTRFSTNIECTRMLMPPSGTISLRNWLHPRATVLILLDWQSFCLNFLVPFCSGWSQDSCFRVSESNQPGLNPTSLPLEGPGLHKV